MTQPHRREQMPPGPAPSFPFVWSLLLPPSESGSEVRAPPPCSGLTGPVVKALPHTFISHVVRQACLGDHWGLGHPQPSCL